ncbi:DUF2777 family protein [Halalkalibacter akibai]|uniref:DUF2777 family protein n=1 Tax=Halalkalibacter akibai (strain ATCC 43226 / DSM 21942 / CIP 109018 / JCM 9157 / 1139) TaxID=1236973 RepID=W4QRS3_HALA3|nr:DUF2777 family protein [Halalkalibacter akibai]GAE34627.1 hypothetical protein JCM9157_1697 [Halalkalibacter akibai JCM 9157]
MDRRKAQSYIGKLVKVDMAQQGTYCATLKDVIAEPRKPWKGIVQIKAVLVLPEFNESNPLMQQLPFKKNEEVELDGAKLSPLANEELPEDFTKSLITASEKRIKQLRCARQATLDKEKLLLDLIESLNSNDNQEHVDSCEEDILYTFHHDGDKYILVDNQDERLELEDCPFIFNWSVKGQHQTGQYDTNGCFIAESGERYYPKEGAVFTISKDQFDPYVILRNELEPTALLSLEKNLHAYQMKHDHLIECHNTLLSQLLKVDGQKSFKGVNFLTYKNNADLVIVQHHYERELHNHKKDKVYDRFEFTTNQGKRSVVMYTNEYSR